MKNSWLRLACASALALGLMVDTYPAFAQAAQTKTVKKTTSHKRTHSPADRPHSNLEQYRSSDFVGQFPGSCAYDRAAGRCVIDLGYGRCMDCNSGPMK